MRNYIFTAIIFIFSFLLWMLTMLCTPVHAEDLSTLKIEMESICKSFNNPCTIMFSDSKKVNAYTTRIGNIIITKGITEKLSYNELRSVALHEVGHHVQKHFDAEDKFERHKRTKIEQQQFRHKQELQADRFALTYHLLSNEQEYLTPALIKISKINGDTVSFTHPAPVKRIQNIQDISKQYNQKLPRLLYNKVITF